MSAAGHLDQSSLSRWWWSVDQAIIAVLSGLIAIGFVLLLAAGPGAAAKLGLSDAFYFPLRQAIFLIPAIGVIIGVSMLTPLEARRLGAITCLLGLVAMAGILLFGGEVNGAKRWIDLGLFKVQPSEFLKPGFVIAASWMLAEGSKNPSFPGAVIGMAIYGLAAGLLILQPDYGQAALLTAVWMVMFFIAGWSVIWLVGLFLAACLMIAGGYLFSNHLSSRIDGFLNPQKGDNFQVDTAMEAVASGGRIGKATDAASVKFTLPDAHTDFIFAVAGEQYGFLLCSLIIGLFGVFVVRSFVLALNLKSVFAQTAVCGLAAMIGLQAFIHIAVSIRALPAKGMTLPFISYGGSSLLATGLAVGLILALTRRQLPARRRREVMP